MVHEPRLSGSKVTATFAVFHQLTVPIMVEEPPPKPANCWSNDFMSSDPLAQLSLDTPKEKEKPKPKPQKDASPPRPVRLPTQHDITCPHTTARSYAAVCIGPLYSISSCLFMDVQAKSSGSPTHTGSSTTTGEKPGPAPAFMGSNRSGGHVSLAAFNPLHLCMP